MDRRPNDAMMLYNAACVHCCLGRTDDGAGDLLRAVKAGIAERGYELDVWLGWLVVDWIGVRFRPRSGRGFRHSKSARGGRLVTGIFSDSRKAES